MYQCNNFWTIVQLLKILNGSTRSDRLGALAKHGFRSFWKFHGPENLARRFLYPHKATRKHPHTCILLLHGMLLLSSNNVKRWRHVKVVQWDTSGKLHWVRFEYGWTAHAITFADIITMLCPSRELFEISSMSIRRVARRWLNTKTILKKRRGYTTR